MSEQRQYTPIFDDVLEIVGPSAALVYGVIWRFCQMENGVCTASQPTIAKRAGISTPSARNQLTVLMKAKLIKGEEKKGIGITYTLLNFNTHPVKVKRATLLNFNNKETLLRDSLRESLLLNSSIPDRADDWPIRDLASAVTGLAPCDADIEVLKAWEQAGIIEEDIRAALAWRKETEKSPSKQLGSLRAELRHPDCAASREATDRKSKKNKKAMCIQETYDNAPPRHNLYPR